MAKKFRLRDFLNRHPALDKLRIGFLAGFCQFGINFVDHSYRVIKIIHPSARPYLSSEKPCLFGVYHGRMVGILRMVPRHKNTVLVSRSRDGEIIARALEWLGFNLARGSPAHKAIEGTMQMVRAAESGQHLTMMVDGPRGPKEEVKSGIIRVAELTGLPIVPFVCSGHSNWWFRGWDKFMGPLITTRIVYIFGEPLRVPKGASEDEKEELRLKLDQRMKRMREMGELFWRTTPGGRDNTNIFHNDSQWDTASGANAKNALV